MEHSANPPDEVWAMWDECGQYWVWSERPFKDVPRTRQVRYQISDGFLDEGRAYADIQEPRNGFGVRRMCGDLVSHAKKTHHNIEDVLAELACQWLAKGQSSSREKGECQDGNDATR